MKKEFPLHLFFDYCPSSGRIEIKKGAPAAIRNSIRIGYGRGVNGTEYKRAKFNRQNHKYKPTEKQLTAIAWKLKTGEWPMYCVRFLDGNHENYKWDNLRQDGSGENE